MFGLVGGRRIQRRYSLSETTFTTGEIWGIWFTVLYVSNESEKSFPQHCILSSTTLHSRSLPLILKISLLFLSKKVTFAEKQQIKFSAIKTWIKHTVVNLIFRSLIRKQIYVRIIIIIIFHLKKISNTRLKNKKFFPLATDFQVDVESFLQKIIINSRYCYNSTNCKV